MLKFTHKALLKERVSGLNTNLRISTPLSGSQAILGCATAT